MAKTSSTSRTQRFPQTVDGGVKRERDARKLWKIGGSLHDIRVWVPPPRAATHSSNRYRVINPLYPSTERRVYITIGTVLPIRVAKSRNR